MQESEQPAGVFQQEGSCLGPQFDDKGEELGQRVSRRCAGFCAGCWLILRLAAGIRWLLDSPWGYLNGCVSRNCEWRGRFASVME